MIEIDVTKILHSPGGQLVLTVQCKISEKQLVTFYGASGVGKTSTLRMIAGLMQPDTGRIVVDGVTWFDAQAKINIPPQQRQLGVVFQDYALFPNMTVQENLVFALTKKQDPKAIPDLVEIMELGALKDRMPETLSGGQKQRAALARALVQTPKILLLDEPLAALDNEIRLKLQDYLLKVHQEYGLTTLLVSHNIGEIIKLSDYLFILQNGKIERKGSPTELFIGDVIPDGFKLIGNVLKKEKDGAVPVILVLVQGNVIPVHVSPSNLSNYHIGDQVVVFFKAFQDATICKL